MANRAAIRELQTRLASRLQSAQSEGAELVWLAVRASNDNYLFPLVQSGEIFPLQGLQRVPYCQSWFLGIVNLRGKLYGVVDHAGFLQGKVVNRVESAMQEASVVTFHSALDINCGLLVDSLSGLRGPDAFASTHGPTEGAPAYFGNQYIDHAGATWQEVNLHALATDSRFLNIVL